jgi:phosphotransacetylase
MTLRDGRSLLFADCAVNPDPGPAELADIAVSSAASCRTLLGEEPRVALLSFSTRGSAVHPRVGKVQAAVAELERRGVDFAFDGELQDERRPRLAVAVHEGVFDRGESHRKILLTAAFRTRASR